MQGSLALLLLLTRLALSGFEDLFSLPVGLPQSEASCSEPVVGCSCTRQALVVDGLAVVSWLEATGLLSVGLERTLSCREGAYVYIGWEFKFV